MVDMQLYQTMFEAAGGVLRQNMQTVGQQFAEGFMAEHDPRNGQMAQRGVEQLFHYVANAAMQTNGRAQIRDNQQLFDFVGSYVWQVFEAFRARQGGGGFGGGQLRGFSSGGFGGGGFGGGGFNTAAPLQAGTLLSEDVIVPASQRMQAQAASQTQAAPAAAASLQAAPMAVTKGSFDMSYAPNPLDDIPDSGVSMSINRTQTNWGMYRPLDESIVMTKRETITYGDDRYTIHSCEGLERYYFDNPMDVVRDFFRIVPDAFLADPFIFNIFYNHVERVDIPTEEFLKVRGDFIAALGRNKEESVYETVLNIVNEMRHAPRKAVTDYLVKHINRALYLAVHIEAKPHIKLGFTQIEDLEELMGSNFRHSFLEVPNAKNIIARVVNNAILNALTSYSDVMFYNTQSGDIDAVKTSNVFPYQLSGVYPSKDMIPVSGTPAAKKFYDAMFEHELSKRTYVRSIRVVTISNILGGKYLSQIGPDIRPIEGRIPVLLNSLVPQYLSGQTADNKVDSFDIRKGSSAAVEYENYIDGEKDAYENKTRSLYASVDAPSLPVDQSLFLIQYKKSPQEYLQAFDVVTTIDSPASRTSALMVTKTVPDLKLTR